MAEPKAAKILNPKWPLSPDQWMRSPVGPGQANDPRDVLNVQKGLNAVIRSGFLQGLELPEDGEYSPWLSFAIQELTNKVAFGAADPHAMGVTHWGIIEPNSALYRWMWEIGSTLGENQAVEPGITKEMYDLAALMVPGGATGKNGVPGGIEHWLGPILEELRAQELADRDMLLMALATIAVEASRFRPELEGKSKYNTSNFGTSKEGKPFDLYDERANLGNIGSPDGKTFRGSGLVQLTGRNNFKSIGDEIGEDLIKNPAKANDDPRVVVRILVRYLKDHETRIRNDLRSPTPTELTDAERNKYKKNPKKIAALQTIYSQNAALLSRHRDLKGMNLADARRAVNGGINGADAFIDAFMRGEDFFRKQDERDIVARIVSTWPACGLPNMCAEPQRPPGTRGYCPAADNSLRTPLLTGLW
jgi:predicted chitinase